MDNEAYELGVKLAMVDAGLVETEKVAGGKLEALKQLATKAKPYLPAAVAGGGAIGAGALGGHLLGKEQDRTNTLKDVANALAGGVSGGALGLGASQLAGLGGEGTALSGLGGMAAGGLAGYGARRVGRGVESLLG